jgi:hypothetical protein
MNSHLPLNEALIDRARKLMAMTVERGASETEAATAARILQQMMAEHNLSFTHIEATGGTTSTGGTRTRENVGRRQVYQWQRSLMKAVASMNFCTSLERFEHRMRGPAIFDGYDLIGRIDNVTTATLMFDYLLATIERLARAEVNNDPTQFFTRYAHSFKEGVSDRLVERLRTQRDEIVAEQERKAKEAAAAQPTGCTLPALLSDVFNSEAELNNDMVNDWEPGTTARKRMEREAADRARAAERAPRFAFAKAQGHSDEVASWYSYGYDMERAIELAKPSKPRLVKPETDKQRARRERKEENESRRYYKRREREASRLDHDAYRSGKAAGNDVSLARQVDGRTNANRLS